MVYKKGSAKIPESNDKSNEIKQFETIVQNDPFVHKENPYDDFKDEILLPHKNSTLGPALAVGDLNNDSREDYIIGGAIAQAPGIFIQQEDGSFKKINIPIFEKDKFYEDLGIEILTQIMTVTMIFILQVVEMNLMRGHKVMKIVFMKIKEILISKEIKPLYQMQGLVALKFHLMIMTRTEI